MSWRYTTYHSLTHSLTHHFDLYKTFIFASVSLDSNQVIFECFPDLWQVGGFLSSTPVSSINISDRHDILEILLKVGVKQQTPNHI